MKLTRGNFIAVVVAWMTMTLQYGLSQKPLNPNLPNAPASYLSPKDVPLTGHVLDEVPKEWKSLPGGTLEEDATHYRAGYQGIRWNWKSSDKLIITNDLLEQTLLKRYLKVAFGGGVGFHLWIYNPQSLTDKTLGISIAANGFNKRIEFGLDYKGWRTCYIQFSEMPDGGEAEEGTIVITPPKGIESGWFVFDRLEIGGLTRHTMADHQLSYSQNRNHWVSQFWWEQAGKPDVSEEPSEDEKAIFATIVKNIKLKSLGWSLHVNDWIHDEERVLMTNKAQTEKAKVKAKRIRSEAKAHYDALGLIRNEKGIFGPNIAAPFTKATLYENDIKWGELERKIFPSVVLDYNYYGDHESRERVLNLLDWFESQGVVSGHSFGSLSHIGYGTRNLAITLLLIRDLLEETDRLDRWVDTLKWLSGFAQCYVEPKRTGAVGDAGTYVMARLISVLMQSDSKEKLRDFKSFMKWLDSALSQSDGTQGIIKHDYSFYHHALMLYGYWATNVAQFYKVIAAFKGTPYANGISAKNLRQNLIVANRMYRGATIPFHLRGRYFKPLGGNRLFGALEKLALDNNGELDMELASTWLNSRLDEKIPPEFKGIDPYNRYHQVANWAGISTHSIPGATVTVTGVSTNIMNWDGGDGRKFSRYNRYGSMYIHGKPQGTSFSTEDCGYVDQGWDWSRLPGVTSLYLSNPELKEATKRTSGYGDHRGFTGGVSLEANGIYGYRISEARDNKWNGSKSYFFFDDRIVCLGSGLQSEHQDLNLETILFQLHIPSTTDAIHVNGEKLSQFPYSGQFQSDGIKLVDTQGHGYYLAEGNDPLVVRKQHQTNGDSFGKVHSGDFALAWIDHGQKPENTQYEYMIQLNNPVSNLDYTVLRQDNTAHVVRDEISGVVGYVIFQPTEDLPGPLTGCSRPGLVMVKPEGNNLKVSFSDPDLMINPGGRKTRYNLTDAPPSPLREITLTLKDSFQKESGKGDVSIENSDTKLHFTTSNALEEKFVLSQVH
ncbi:MAG: chondroitinase family polysaccharide lyase [Flavobacteriaceae bacterium]|nr:chondroitinase family polysaccharide lyase [Flavobacteriaceae bacterium]